MLPGKRTRARPPAALAAVHAAITACTSCTRLRAYCQKIAREKKAAYRHDTYWGRPVPGFGDPAARVLLVGLAPAAHGANRTGRVFTGDGTGGSGDFLMAALHRAGFANLPTSRAVDDGLRLKGAYIAAAVRCAPPDNKPMPGEIAACLAHLDAEVAALPRVGVVVALGRIAWDAWFQLLARHGLVVRPRPAFGHLAVWTPEARAGDETRRAGASAREHPALGATLIGAFHPSRQNTNTGKLTPDMYDALFAKVRALVG